MNERDTFVNWINPVSGQKNEWDIDVNDDIIEKSLAHISNDSFFTLKILKEILYLSPLENFLKSEI